MKLTQRKRLAELAKQPMRPVYRVSELALLVGVSTFAMRTLLKRHGVEIVKGNPRQPDLVYLVALREGMAELYTSMLLAKAATQLA
jgi:hypothetical protein